ncbi:Checkpoint protein HUS1 [Acipenser ruthenus]|uniref:Checkpoint protein HUS1 n=1 Tax=Acipenser ruthenus TaxID=7906 RepID=A0A444V4W0_ACIRT|nr:Checkpoint protein HUS1 [Acipenser ruthenus]
MIKNIYMYLEYDMSKIGTPVTCWDTVYGNLILFYFFLLGVVNTISKLTKTCTLRLTTDKLYFILSDKVANGGVSMWCELSQGNFFDEFQLEGVSTEHNEIYMDLAAENLSRALKTAHNAKSLKIKLTNKHCPCITVAVELPSLSRVSRVVTHDIPVGVIPKKLWNDFKEPSVPDFDVSDLKTYFLLDE